MTTRPKVLLVDDQAEVVVGLSRVLARVAGDFDFEVASSGSEALACLDTGAYAVVVSDLRMPEMSGIELLDLVAGRSPSIGRVLLSGTFEPDAAARALSTAHRFLSKPCSARSLAATCRELYLQAPTMTATNIGAIIALAIEDSAMAHARRVVDHASLVGALGAHPALIAAVLHALGSEFLGSRAEPTTLSEVVNAIGHAGFDRVLSSGALRVVPGMAAAPIVEHAHRARARADVVRSAGGSARDVLAALLVDVDRLGCHGAAAWDGLRPRGGDVGLLELWGVTASLVDSVRSQSGHRS